MKFLSTLGMVWILIAFASSGYAGGIQYPEDYRQWAHVKSMLIEKGHPLENPFQGLHHVYGNKKAMQGLDDGHFADGSVLVFDLLKGDRGNHAVQEGERKLVGVMKKDRKAFASTGGWGFEGFAGDTRDKRLVTDGGKSCFACHTSQKEHDYVFSRMRQ